MSERNDETITEVREARGRISAQFAHDPKRLVAHYMEMQKQYQERLLSQNAPVEPQEQKAT